MNLYVLYDNKVGNVFAFADNANLTCEEFYKLVDSIALQVGDDAVNIKEVLIKQYGFKQFENECVYQVKHNR